MAPIFISYYRDDVPQVARRIGTALEQRFGADSVFIDVSDIAGGAAFVSEIDGALDAASVLLVVIGLRWRDLRHRPGYDYVGHEVARGNLPEDARSARARRRCADPHCGGGRAGDA